MRAQALAQSVPAKSLLLQAQYRQVFTFGKLLVLKFPFAPAAVRRGAAAAAAHALSFSGKRMDPLKQPVLLPGSFIETKRIRHPS